ncbi:hypothetical protein AB4X15_10565 [Peribacillus simplex]|nr:hypothetical protein [Brevibacillus sp. JNUCC-41]QOS89185.1 hypothetical protein JNUCC41_20820 [Brevibacillus sp. JNUCC-41]
METYETAKEHIFDGKTLLFIDGMANGFVLHLKRKKTERLVNLLRRG